MKAVVFDLDGTLIDSLDLWHKLDIEFLAKRNKVIDEGCRKIINELPFREAVAYLLKFYDIDMSVDDGVNEFNENALKAYSTYIEFKEGAVDFINYLNDKGYVIALATSCTADCAKAILEKANVYDKFDKIFFAHESGNGKGDVKFFENIIDSLNVKPEETILYEDMFYSAETAKKIGINCVGVDNGNALPEGYTDRLSNTAERIICNFLNEKTYY